MFIVLFASVASSATYYVRDDGGTATQCVGTTDAAYPGSGTSQPCAYSHPAWSLGGPSTSGTLAAGDTLIIDNESHLSPGTQAKYMIGLGMPNASCSSSFPWDCYMDPVPAGVDSSNKTKIYGKGYASCGSTPTISKAQLWGNERTYQVLTLSSNVDVQCLEITDHSSCIESGPRDGNIGGDPVQCERTTYPYGAWAPTGINASNADNVSSLNVDVHGMASRGILNYRGGDWDLTNNNIIANAFVGWDSDGPNNCTTLAGDTPACTAHDCAPGDATCPACTADTANGCYWRLDNYTGTVNFTSTKIQFSGCGEVYPKTQWDWDSTTDLHHCWSQDQGGFGDGIGLGDGSPGDWNFYNSSISWNASDGVDLLHGDGTTGTLLFSRSRAEGNAGNQFKTSVLNAYIENSVIGGNCGFFAGQTFTSTVGSQATEGACDAAFGTWTDGKCYLGFNNCRAQGDVIAFANTVDGQKLYVYNSTILSNGGSAALSSGNNCGASTVFQFRNNILRIGRDWLDDTTNNPAGGNRLSGFYYAAGNDGSGGGSCGSLVADEDYNIFYTAKTATGQCAGAHSICASDPLLAVNIPMGPGTYMQDTDPVNKYYLQSASPAIGFGITSLTFQDGSADYNDIGRGGTWDDGAFEYLPEYNSRIMGGIIRSLKSNN